MALVDNLAKKKTLGNRHVLKMTLVDNLAEKKTLGNRHVLKMTRSKTCINSLQISLNFWNAGISDSSTNQ